MPWASGGGGSSSTNTLLAFFVQTAGTSQSTTSATQADIDATNAAVTFTAPTGGIVLVRASVQLQMNAVAQLGQLGLREGSTNIAGPNVAMSGNTASGYHALCVATFRISGISGGSHTYKLAYAVTGGATLTAHQIGSSATDWPITMEVWTGV